MMSSDDPIDGGARIGAELREAREQLGWELPAVAAGLRIRLPYLEAIEAGRMHDLPGVAYAIGFLRTYAMSLGLDPDEMTRRFRAASGVSERKTELAFPAPVPDRGVPAGALALLGIVLVVLAYGAWYHFAGDKSHIARTIPAVPDRLASLAGPTAPPSNLSPQVASVLPSPSPAGGTEAVPPVAPVPPTQAAAAMPPHPAAAAAVPPPAAPALAAPAPAEPAAVTPAADVGQITLRAKANAWVQVRQKQGSVLYNRVLHPGDTWDVPRDKGPLLLSVGNAAGTELLVDGVAAPPFGGANLVRRDLPLDPDLIREGKLPGQPNGPNGAVTPAAATGAPPPASTPKPQQQ